MSTTLITPALRQEIEQLMRLYPKPRSAILMALHRLQEELGWVPEPAQAEVAEIMKMHPEEVKSLVTFYYQYHRQPVGRYVIKVCRSISCYLRGANDIIGHLEERLNIKVGETTGDGQFTLVASECLAGCCGAPCLQVNDRFLENVTSEGVDDLLLRLRGGDRRFPAAVMSWKGGD